MSPELSELRPELTAASNLGPSLVTTGELIERRGGRYLPSVEVSKGELDALTIISHMAERAYNSALILPSREQLAKVTFDQELGCWDLPANPRPHQREGYGYLTVPGIDNPSGRGHRTMYLVFFGLDALPNGRHDFLDHICENKACCYPRHLERVTVAENTRRGRVSAPHDHPRLI